ncbi:MAG: hypothetical protein HQL67_12885 [Magnetococcales bacterium]|nr:hypothetical protein [Magnetococcales bacterium]
MIEGWKEKAQLIGWLGFFCWMIASGYHVTYLAELQSQILLVATGILALAFLVRWPRTRPVWRMNYRSWIESAGHFLPISIFLIMGTTSLTLSDSGLGGANIRVLLPEAQTKTFSPENLKPGEYLKTSLVDLYAFAGLDQGFPVEMVGRVHIMSPEESIKHFPDRKPTPNALFYRYAIACCAADASPVATVLEGFESGKLVSGDWVRIRGQTSFFETAQGNRMIVLRSDFIEEIEKPIKPYLSWLQTLK